MTGKAHVPDLIERLIRGQRAGTTRTAGGYARGASPGMTRDRVGAGLKGGGIGITVQRSSKIDTFSIADDSDSTFTCTFAPLADSWNLKLNGVDVSAAEFSISGRVITIVDAADLFLGAATQGSPWTLEIQYDYLTGVPSAPTESPVTPELVWADASNGPTPHTHSFDAGHEPAVGELIVLAILGDVSAPTVAGYTHHTPDESEAFCHLSVWTKVSDGTETGVTGTASSGSVTIASVRYTSGSVVATNNSSQDAGTTTYNLPTVAVGADTLVVHCLGAQNSVTGIALGGADDVGVDVSNRIARSVSTTALAIGDWVPGSAGTEPGQTTADSSDRWCGITLAVEG